MNDVREPCPHCGLPNCSISYWKICPRCFKPLPDLMQRQLNEALAENARLRTNLAALESK